MAFLDSTDWNDVQISDAAMNDNRFSELGLLDAVKDSTMGVPFLTPGAMEKLRTFSSLRDVQFPILKDLDVVVNETPSFATIPSNLSESDQYSFTAVDVFSGFRHYPAQYDNNVLDAEFDKRERMKNIAYAMGQRVEELLTTTIELRKTQVLNFTNQVSTGDGTYTFNSTTDTLEIDKDAQDETMYYSLVDLMDANELRGNLRIVTNRAGLTRQKAQALKFGAGNQQNLNALDFFGSDMMYATGGISTGSDIFNGYLLRDGSIGIVENHPFDFRAGTSFAGKTWTITDVDLPWARMRANIYTNNQATDGTALVGAGTDSNMIMTHFSEMAIWLRFYIVYRYNTDITTRANDIVKIKGLST